MLESGFYCMDCMAGMKEFPDKYFELAIVDPPYGIDIAHMNMGIGNSKKCSKKENRAWKPADWDKSAPGDEYFKELFRVSVNQIIFGGNYFNLPPTRCFVIWDKCEGIYGRDFSECEYMWTSFNHPSRLYRQPPFDKRRIHPTQKPVALYEWLLSKYAKPGDKILDTHVGSASSLIACYNRGFEYTGFEIDKTYFDMATKRLEAHKAQKTIFDYGITR